MQSELSAEEYFRAVKANLSPGYTLIRKSKNRFVLSSNEKSTYLNFRFLIRVPRVIVGEVRQEQNGCAITAKIKMKALVKAYYLISLTVYALLVYASLGDSRPMFFGAAPVAILSVILVVYPLVVAYFSRGNVDLLKEQLTRVL